ncbi:Mitochondrial import inner membrane translocase subunit TIM8 [Pestalotiopsis fici W106-1]|uniref:Mitochondrial import inner membrane translocase subunit n=1 Tax=Pestalotiopsis fici (strain W106-1 / CGMCC3.15140) TaxID=1229662 RepID=W3WRN8_PESFW|nr:Mitochondrial import inner membrane translocase subunit TIM8 [Pestalotiopsis fici W106-1]ETS76523.1 Mitochondrial import inner membrane translocase subunit TIM8 [Pestalotiopsis fici W106-1]
MDGSNLSDFELDKLNEQDKQQLRTFLNNENQKARVQSTIHSLTDVCFKKCITGPIKSGQMDKNEQSCMANCADRFLDVSSLTMKNLQTMRQ